MAGGGLMSRSRRSRQRLDRDCLRAPSLGAALQRRAQPIQLAHQIGLIGFVPGHRASTVHGKVTVGPKLAAGRIEIERAFRAVDLQPNEIFAGGDVRASRS